MNVRARCIPETALEVPSQEPIETKAQTPRVALGLDILDIKRVIDIYAEGRSVEEFDAKMRKDRSFLSGFFARSILRMGRDAWIDSRKRELIAEIEAGLKTGRYTEGFLRSHVESGDQGIVENAHLKHEEILMDESANTPIQSAVDAWLAAPVWSKARKQNAKNLKAALEASYPITADLNQLEQSLVRLEQAKIQSEIETVEAKLNILDIGRIENGGGQRKEGWVVGMADKISKSDLPDFFKQKVVGLISHPNVAAIVTALAARWAVSGVAGVAAVASFAGGFFIPLAAGAAVGGLFAGVRAKREMRDRTNQIDRRGATGYQTGAKAFDGKSSTISIHDTKLRQASVSETLEYLESFQNKPNPTEKERLNALSAVLCYLVRHLVGRESNLNLLQFSQESSVSRQHVWMVRIANQLFPGLVASFNDETLFDEENESEESEIAKELLEKFRTSTSEHMEKRIKEENSYAAWQGLKFAGVALGVGSAVQSIISVLPHGHFDTVTTEWATQTVTKYPDNLESVSVKRWFWYDNQTPAPKFEHTELMIHADKSGGWNVSHMLGKTATSLHHGSHTITANDFIDKHIQAVVTPVKWGQSFTISIDGTGKFQIPQSMQSAFDNRTFHSLEVGEVNASGKIVNLNPIATVVGKGSMVLESVTIEVPGTPLIAHKWISEPTPFYAVPLGANRYHELKTRQRIESALEPTPKPPKEPKGPEADPLPVGSNGPIAPGPLTQGAEAEIPSPIPPENAWAQAAPDTPRKPEPPIQSAMALQERKEESELLRLSDEELYRMTFGKDEKKSYAEIIKQYPEKKDYLAIMREIWDKPDERKKYFRYVTEMETELRKLLDRLPASSYGLSKTTPSAIHYEFLKQIHTFRNPKAKKPEYYAYYNEGNPLDNLQSRKNIVQYVLGSMVTSSCCEKAKKSGNTDEELSFLKTDEKTSLVVDSVLKESGKFHGPQLFSIGEGLARKYGN